MVLQLYRHTLATCSQVHANTWEVVAKEDSNEVYLGMLTVLDLFL